MDRRIFDTSFKWMAIDLSYARRSEKEPHNLYTQRKKLVYVQALLPKTAVERYDKDVRKGIAMMQ